MEIIKGKTNIDFIGKRRIALWLSSVVNIAILTGIALYGFNFGVDFTGGTVMEVRFQKAITPAELRELARSSGQEDAQVQAIGNPDENTFMIRLGGVTQLTPESAEKAKSALQGLGTISAFAVELENGLVRFRSATRLDRAAIKSSIESTGTGVREVNESAETAGTFDYRVVSSGIADLVTKTLSEKLGSNAFTVQRVDYVGPQVGKQLRNKGVVALLLAMGAIILYVSLRFDFKFGPGALISMFHDAVMVAGFFLISRREFNLTSIAALLTVIGYSINDTIVVYDRIREEMARYRGKPLSEIVNIAINDTLSRTILTSGVTALSLFGLIIFARGELFDFALAMLIGILAGTYSSIYIASPMVIWLAGRENKKRA